MDIDSSITKGKRKHKQLQNICAFLTGLVCSTNYEAGQLVLDERNFTEFEEGIQTMLEISRRYKITNPEKMRSEYGKLVMLMQDAVSTDIQPLLGINVHREVMTVYQFLADRGRSFLSHTHTLFHLSIYITTFLDSKIDGTAILQDVRIEAATREILAKKGQSRPEIQGDIKKKERAADSIAKYHCSRKLSEDQIKHCLYRYLFSYIYFSFPHIQHILFFSSFSPFFLLFSLTHFLTFSLPLFMK